jgi:hypothetical protein
VIADIRQPGMIADVSLRALYLIFQQVLGMILLMSRVLNQRRRAPRTTTRGRRTPSHQPEATHGLG